MTFTVKVAGSGTAFPCEPREFVLDAAERAGYSMPSSCRKGACNTCEATVKICVNGVDEYTVAEGDGPVNALDSALRQALRPFYPAIDEISLEVDLFDGPGVLDSVAEHVVEDRELHGAKGEAEARVEDVRRCGDGGVGITIIKRPALS